MREDEDVAEATGISTVNYKLLAFAMGASGRLPRRGGLRHPPPVGLPGSFNITVSITVLAVVILGGMGSIPGVVVGALALIGLPELLREFAEFRLLVYGAVLVLMMLLRPEGLIPDYVRRRELHEEVARSRSRRRPASTSGPRTSDADDRPRHEPTRLTADEPACEWPRPTDPEDSGSLVGDGGHEDVRGPRRQPGHRLRDPAPLDRRRSSGRTAPARRPSSTSSAAIYAPTSGTITFDGVDISGMAPHQVAELGVARTYQNIRLFHNMTVLANVTVGRHVRMQGPVVPRRSSATRAIRREEEATVERGARAARSRRPATVDRGPAREEPSLRRPATAGGRRARSPATRSCCCSTSRRPA